MKKIALLAGLILVFVLLPCAASAFGNISVTSTPSGASVFVDNVNKGMTTIVIENIISGSHTIVIQKAGYQDYTQSITVNENQTTSVSATLIAAPTISSITPSNGFNTSIVSISDLTGTGFSTGATVKLTKYGQENITAWGVSVTATHITCNFDITGKPAGFWTVVVTNPDGQSATKADGFEIKNALTTAILSSITPNSGIVNSTVTITDLAGSNFLGTATIRLKRTGYNDIPGTVTTQTSTKITGTFDLNGRTPGSYEVCVLNDGINPVCALAFVITAQKGENGSINFMSVPSGSKVFLSSGYEGDTPLTLYDITPGLYTVLVQKAGYRDWSERITVTSGNRTYVIARLTAEAGGTTVVTTVPTLSATTVKTTKKSTVKVPTPWPTAPPTPASPVGMWVIVGAVGTGLVLLRKT